MFLEDEYELIVYFENAITRIGKTAHNSAAAGRIHCGLLLPYDSPHVIHSKRLAETDYLGSYRDNLISAVIHRTGELVADIYAQAAAVMQYAIAFRPNCIQIVYITLIAVVEADLPVVPIILQLPIWRRCDYKMDGFVFYARQIAAISLYQSMRCFHVLSYHKFLLPILTT